MKLLSKNGENLNYTQDVSAGTGNLAQRKAAQMERTDKLIFDHF